MKEPSRAPKPDTRAKVLEAATALFLERGVEATSVAEICQASGASNGSVFHHFGNKDEIAVEVFLRFRREYLEQVVPALEGGDAVEGIKQAIRAAFRYATEHESEFRYMLTHADAPWAQRAKARIVETNQPYLQRAVMSLAKNVQAGKLPAYSPAAYGAFIFGTPDWISRAALTGTLAPNFEMVANEVADAVGLALVAAAKVSADRGQ